MHHDLEVSETIDINATPEKVWHALTDPEIIKEYLFGTNTQTDWQVGSPVTFSGEYNGQRYTDKGIVLENIHAQKLKYSYWSSFSGIADEAGNYAKITYTLTPRDNGMTGLTWTQTGYASEAGYEHSKTGMGDFLKQIKAIIER